MMEKIKINVNGIDLNVNKGATILDAVRDANFRYLDMTIPTLHYLKGIQDVDTSGVCAVEADGELVNAAAVRVKSGMAVKTRSDEVVAARREALEGILAVHNHDCINCVRTDNCELQELLHDYGFKDEPSLKESALGEIDTSSVVLVRDNNKCVRCKRCINVCAKVQAVSAIVCTGDGLEAEIVPASPGGLAAASCVNCGQCVAVCPVGALYEKDSTREVYDAIRDPEKIVIAQVAPAVRAALGEEFDFPVGVDVEGKIAAALRILGFDKAFDTKFSADLTILEEAHELIGRITDEGVLPLMTSCCPGWVKYCEHFYPDMLDNMSSCKSPQQMFGAVAKSYYAEKMGIAKENIVVVSVMPCVAKKFELTRPDEDGAGVRDVDVSITTRELARMIRGAEIQLSALKPEAYDDFMGTGAGVIFGASGGVMEAALRTAAEKLMGKTMEKLDFVDVRGMNGTKEASYQLSDVTVKVAVVSGLANANALLTKIKRGEADYQFIEVMACHGGCVNGGGQPHQPSKLQAVLDVPAARSKALYTNDEHSKLRKSHENPSVVKLYEEYLGKPGSEKAHQLLHTSYIAR